jgi:hypothetical protein
VGGADPLAKGSNVGRGTAKTGHETGELGHPRHIQSVPSDWLGDVNNPEIRHKSIAESAAKTLMVWDPVGKVGEHPRTRLRKVGLVNHETFYVAAATVIPLLLIAVMATRSLKPGQLHLQRISTILIFGLPVIGEIAAFSFLFFQPVPSWASSILAVATWAGLLSQLVVAIWWTHDLVTPYRLMSGDEPPVDVSSPPTAPIVKKAAPVKKGAPAKNETSTKTPAPTKICPMCGALLPEGHGLCTQCGRSAS